MKPMPHGGARPVAGRPKGSHDKRPRMTATRKLLEQAKIKAADFEMPVYRLIRRLNDANLSEEYRDKLAAIAICSSRLPQVIDFSRASGRLSDDGSVSMPKSRAPRRLELRATL